MHTLLNTQHAPSSTQTNYARQCMLCAQGAERPCGTRTAVPITPKPSLLHLLCLIEAATGAAGHATPHSIAHLLTYNTHAPCQDPSRVRALSKASQSPHINSIDRLWSHTRQTSTRFPPRNNKKEAPHMRPVQGQLLLLSNYLVDSSTCWHKHRRPQSISGTCGHPHANSRMLPTLCNRVPT